MKLVNILTILGGISTTYAMTVQELIKDMGVGWNLGNTLEACGDWINGSTVKQYETSWGNPETTEEMIKGIKSYGFKSIRVPVAWSNLIASDYTINPLLLARAKEIVNYIINNDMYAIMNIHWDNGWFENFATKEEESFTKYRRIWEQISDYFKDVNENLIFESLNEEGCWNTVWNRWSNQGDKSKAYGLLNEMNQNFVDIVRNSGGNNTERHLLLAGYCTDIDLTIDEAYVVPKDDRVMVSVHYYTPSTFTILEEDADWGKAQPTWGSESEVEYLLNDFKKIKTRFVDNGIPVVIGEYGTVTKNKDINSVHKFLKTVAETSLNSGMCPFLWDNGEHFNRKTLVFRDEAIGEIYKVLSSSLNQNNPSLKDEKCWSEPDYPCCKNSCYVVLNDGQEWGSENGEWCGIPSKCEALKSAKDSCAFYPDYPCCPTCDVFLTEEDGSRWGVLDGNWCSIKNNC